MRLQVCVARAATRGRRGRRQDGGFCGCFAADCATVLPTVSTMTGIAMLPHLVCMILRVAAQLLLEAMGNVFISIGRIRLFAAPSASPAPASVVCMHPST